MVDVACLHNIVYLVIFQYLLCSFIVYVIVTEVNDPGSHEDIQLKQMEMHAPKSLEGGFEQMEIDVVNQDASKVEAICNPIQCVSLAIKDINRICKVTYDLN